MTKTYKQFYNLIKQITTAFCRDLIDHPEDQGPNFSFDILPDMASRFTFTQVCLNLGKSFEDEEKLPIKQIAMDIAESIVMREKMNECVDARRGHMSCKETDDFSYCLNEMVMCWDQYKSLVSNDNRDMTPVEEKFDDSLMDLLDEYDEKVAQFVVNPRKAEPSAKRGNRGNK